MFGALAACLGVISFLPYIFSILQGETRPHRTTYGIWSLIGLVEVLSYFASGARITVLLPLIYLLGEAAIFLLSIRRGMGGTSRLDIFCLAGAALGVVGWAVTDNPHVALYLSLSASFCGFLPTVKKTYLLPHTENNLSWTIASMAAMLNLLAVPHLAFDMFIYPVYLFLFDSIEALLTQPLFIRRYSQDRVRDA